MSFYSETEIAAAMTVKLDDVLPEKTVFEEGIRRAPDRGFRLSQSQTEIALKMPYAMYLRSSTKKSFQNFWRTQNPWPHLWLPLETKDRIYGKPIDEYKGTCTATKAMQVMIDNNLSFEIALYPYELVTYGETGSVCANWMQYCLIKNT